MRAVSTIILSALVNIACAPATPVGEHASPVIEGTPETPSEADPAASEPEALPPDATEPPSESGLPVPGACEAPWGYTWIDLADLLGDPEPWDGAKVATFGPVFPRILCTMMECPPVATCCKQCWMSHVMSGPVGSGIRVDDDVAIDILQPECVHTCACAEKGGPIGDAIVWGTLRWHGDSVSIEADGFCNP